MRKFSKTYEGEEARKKIKNLQAQNCVPLNDKLYFFKLGRLSVLCYETIENPAPVVELFMESAYKRNHGDSTGWEFETPDEAIDHFERITGALDIERRFHYSPVDWTCVEGIAVWLIDRLDIQHREW